MPVRLSDSWHWDALFTHIKNTLRPSTLRPWLSSFTPRTVSVTCLMLFIPPLLLFWFVCFHWQPSCPRSINVPTWLLYQSKSCSEGSSCMWKACLNYGKTEACLASSLYNWKQHPGCWHQCMQQRQNSTLSIHASENWWAKALVIFLEIY